MSLARKIWIQQDMSVATAALDFTSTVLGTDVTQPTHDVRDLTMQLRMVKSPAEIALIQKATDASIASQLAGMRSIKPGVRERTVAGIEAATMLEQGCERVSYPAIVGSGFNSTVLHYSENSKTMAQGDVVVIDAAGEYSMYASDLTRTMPVDGHFSPRQKEIYDIVLGAQQAARDAFVAGKSKMGGSDHRGADADHTFLDKVAFDYINSHGKDLHGDPLGKYFVHGSGTFRRHRCARSLRLRQTLSRLVPCSPSSLESTFPKRRSASALKTHSMSMMRGSSLISQKNYPTRQKTLRRR